MRDLCVFRGIFRSAPTDVCAICLEKLGSDGVVTCTNDIQAHGFHEHCMAADLKKRKDFRCSICKFPLSTEAMQQHPVRYHPPYNNDRPESKWVGHMFESKVPSMAYSYSGDGHLRLWSLEPGEMLPKKEWRMSDFFQSDRGVSRAICKIPSDQHDTFAFIHQRGERQWSVEIHKIDASWEKSYDAFPFTTEAEGDGIQVDLPELDDGIPFHIVYIGSRRETTQQGADQTVHSLLFDMNQFILNYRYHWDGETAVTIDLRRLDTAVGISGDFCKFPETPAQQDWVLAPYHKNDLIRINPHGDMLMKPDMKIPLPDSILDLGRTRCVLFKDDRNCFVGMGPTGGRGRIYLLSRSEAGRIFLDDSVVKRETPETFTVTGPFEEEGRPYVLKDVGTFQEKTWMLCGWESGKVTLFDKNDFLRRKKTVTPHSGPVKDAFLRETDGAILLWTCSDDGTMISTPVDLT